VDGIRPLVIDASAMMRKVLAKLTGQRTVPNVWIEGKFVGGCGDGPEPWMGVEKLKAAGKLADMMKSSDKLGKSGVRDNERTEGGPAEQLPDGGQPPTGTGDEIQGDS